MGAGNVNQYSTLATLDANALVRKYSTELRRKAILKSIYTNLRGETMLFKGQQMAIPNAIYTKIKATDTAGANNVRITMKDTLQGNILRGRTVALGTEVAPAIKTGTIYRNNYRFVVQDEPGYGEDKLDAAPYRLYEEHVKDLSPHAAAEEDLEIHMALLETYGWNLMAGSTATVCPAEWNRNMYVLGAPLQPLFHPNYATYTNRIVSAMNNASGGNGGFAQSASQMLTGNSLDNILRWALRRRMKPLTINGKHAFVLTISPIGAQRFSDPNFADSMASRWTNAGQIANEKIQSWYGLLGVWNSAIGACIYVVVDERHATVLPSGSSEPFGLTPGYVWPIDSDLRNLDNTTLRDVYVLHGMGALINWEAEALHLIQDDYDYNIRNGKGYAGVRGIQCLQFDSNPASTDGSGREYWGSAIIIAGREEGTTTERIIESANP